MSYKRLLLSLTAACFLTVPAFAFMEPSKDTLNTQVITFRKNVEYESGLSVGDLAKICRKVGSEAYFQGDSHFFLMTCRDQKTDKQASFLMAPHDFQGHFTFLLMHYVPEEGNAPLEQNKLRSMLTGIYKILHPQR